MNALAATIVLLVAAVPEEDDPSWYRPRGAVRGTLLTGFPDMAALSGSYYFQGQPLELEGGLSASLGSALLSLRAGPRVWTETRRERFSMTLGVAALVGVRGGLVGHWAGVAPNAVGALDVILWGGRQAGMVIQLAGGFIYLPGGEETQGTAFAPDVRLSIGVVF